VLMWLTCAEAPIYVVWVWGSLLCVFCCSVFGLWSRFGFVGPEKSGLVSVGGLGFGLCSAWVWHPRCL